MSPEKTKILFEKYPELFVEKDFPPNQSNMCFGFECSDGWFNLLDNLCKSIMGYQKYNKTSSVHVNQVKEKFGSLRFYYTGGDDYIDGMVRLAEVISETTCEECGDAGKIDYSAGWLRCRCDKHA
jgi:hypothetical protein